MNLSLPETYSLIALLQASHNTPGPEWIDGLIHELVHAAQDASAKDVYTEVNLKINAV